jgi:hypothetical protein
MSTNLVEIPAREEAHQDSLAERMVRAPLLLPEALRCATEIATALRDLHEHGLAYGAVSSQLIELGPAGATLRATGTLKRLGDSHRDVMAFGEVLQEMLDRDETAGGGLQGLHEEARALAERCRTEAPPMRQVLIALRLLVFEARFRGPAVRPRRAVVRRMPVAAAPVERAPVHARVRIRIRIRLALQWKPLASLASMVAGAGE